VLRVAPSQPEEKKKYHGTIRDMITASSYTFFIAKGRYQKRVHSVGLIFVSARTNQRPWHHHRVCMCVCTSVSGLGWERGCLLVLS